MCEYQYKILIVGDVGVGKSALFARYLEDEFSEDYECTVLFNPGVCEAKVDGKTGVLVLWDASGDEWYRKSVRKLYKMDIQGFIIAYDTTCLSSFSDVDYWLKDLRDFGPEDADRILVGTKCDMKEERQVDREKAARYAEQHGLSLIEASAKTSDKVKEVFDTLALRIHKRLKLDLEPPPPKRSKKADTSDVLPAKQDEGNGNKDGDGDGDVPA